MSIKPSFDLNNTPLNDLDTLHKLGRNTLVSDCYEPGSTFKIVTYSAGIEEEKIINYFKTFTELSYMGAYEETVCFAVLLTNALRPIFDSAIEKMPSIAKKSPRKEVTE